MKTLQSMLLLATTALFLGLSSCSKKCVLSENSDSGAIIQDVIIYPSSGSMTGNMGNEYVINGSHKYANAFDLRIGDTEKTPFNSDIHTILCYPTTSSCAASFSRSVLIDNAAQTVKYSIDITQCKDCLQEVSNENYVLVPAFPENYEVSYAVTYTDK
jgi:hypothetical protein